MPSHLFSHLWIISLSDLLESQLSFPCSRQRTYDCHVCQCALRSRVAYSSTTCTQPRFHHCGCRLHILTWYHFQSYRCIFCCHTTPSSRSRITCCPRILPCILYRLPIYSGRNPECYHLTTCRCSLHQLCISCVQIRPSSLTYSLLDKCFLMHLSLGQILTSYRNWIHQCILNHRLLRVFHTHALYHQQIDPHKWQSTSCFETFLFHVHVQGTSFPYNVSHRAKFVCLYHVRNLQAIRQHTSNHPNTRTLYIQV